MAAVALPYRNNPPWLAILVVLAIIAFVIQFMFHATIRHGSEADQVRECLAHQKPVMTWEKDDRQFLVCQGAGWYGIQVVVQGADGVWREITSFIYKHHGKPVTMVETIIRYLEGTGATWIP